MRLLAHLFERSCLSVRCSFTTYLILAQKMTANYSNKVMCLVVLVFSDVILSFFLILTLFIFSFAIHPSCIDSVSSAFSRCPCLFILRVLSLLSRSCQWIAVVFLSYRETTEEIRVTVIPFYMGSRDSQGQDVFWWRYCIRLENMGDLAVQLRERHWRIFALNGTLETVSIVV